MLERIFLTTARGEPKADSQFLVKAMLAEALALASEKVQRQLGGAVPRKVIVVPDRLVNIVA